MRSHHPIVTIARAVCIFLGFTHIGAQLFFSTFDLALMVSGISGLLAGILATRPSTSNIFLLVVCTLGISAISVDAYRYYTSVHVPGNYYAWPEAVLFVLAFIVIGVSVVRIKPATGS